MLSLRYSPECGTIATSPRAPFWIHETQSIGSLPSRQREHITKLLPCLGPNLALGLLFPCFRAVYPLRALCRWQLAARNGLEPFLGVLYTVYCIEQRTLVWDSWRHSCCLGRRPVESRRLEDRIRELCTKAVATPEPAEFNKVIQQLREALHEHAKRLRQLAAAKPPSPERRNRS
jgi:hypothetical protein